MRFFVFTRGPSGFLSSVGALVPRAWRSNRVKNRKAKEKEWQNQRDLGCWDGWLDPVLQHMIGCLN